MRMRGHVNVVPPTLPQELPAMTKQENIEALRTKVMDALSPVEAEGIENVSRVASDSGTHSSIMVVELFKGTAQERHETMKALHEIVAAALRMANNAEQV